MIIMCSRRKSEYIMLNGACQIAEPTHKVIYKARKQIVKIAKKIYHDGNELADALKNWQRRIFYLILDLHYPNRQIGETGAPIRT